MIEAHATGTARLRLAGRLEPIQTSGARDFILTDPPARGQGYCDWASRDPAGQPEADHSEENPPAHHGPGPRTQVARGRLALQPKRARKA